MDYQSFEELEKTLDNFSDESSQTIEELEDKYRPLLNQFNTEKLVEMSEEYKEEYVDVPAPLWVFYSMGACSLGAPFIALLKPPREVSEILALTIIPVSFITGYLLHRRKKKRDERKLVSEFVSTFGEEAYKERFHGSIKELVEFYTSLSLYRDAEV